MTLLDWLDGAAFASVPVKIGSPAHLPISPTHDTRCVEVSPPRLHEPNGPSQKLATNVA